MQLNTVVYWQIPNEISLELQANPTAYVGVNLYRSNTENGVYDKLNDDPIELSKTTYEDLTVPLQAKEFYFYLIRFVRNDDSESKYYLAYTQLSPKEMRLGEYLRNTLSPFISCSLSDADIIAGLQYGLKIFNEVPTKTAFTISTLPSTLEPIILTLSAMFAFMNKYVPIALTDMGYSDNGLSLTLDRGAKIQNVLTLMNNFIEKYIVQFKWNYTSMGGGVGTLALPLSLGGKMGSQLLEILNIFTIIGR